MSYGFPTGDNSSSPGRDTLEEVYANLFHAEDALVRPNAVSGGDPDQTKYLESGHIPTAKSYLDVLTSWSTNEYAIDYTGTAAYALAWFAKPEGLTASQIKLTRAFPGVTK